MKTPPRKTDKMPVWADVLLTFWVLVVAVVYFGPVIAPVMGAARAGEIIGAWTQPASLVYLLLTLLAAVLAALRFLRRRGAAGQNKG